MSPPDQVCVSGCRHAVAAVLSAGASVFVAVAASVRADVVLLLLRRARAAAGLDAGGHAQYGSLLLGGRTPASLHAVRGAAVRTGTRPPGLRALPAQQVLSERAQSAALQLLLLPQQRLAAPDRGGALRPRVDPRHDGGGSERLRHAERAAGLPGQLQRLLARGGRRKDRGAVGGGAVAARLSAAAAGSWRAARRPGRRAAATPLLRQHGATPRAALPRLPAALPAQTSDTVPPAGGAAALAKPAGK